MTPKKTICGFLMPLTAATAFAWGQKGHDTTAYIAECHLTPAAKEAISDLLDGKSIVYYANWLDNASNTPEYAHTKTWHYKNIDAGVAFEEAPLNENGDVVRAIRAQTAILNDPKKSKEERALALKIVVHLVGDIHQPMHMGHLSDRGGNQHRVSYFDRSSNLHSIWDSSLPESAHKWSYTEWQQQTDRLDSDGQIEIIKEGSPEKWGKETFSIATSIYDSTPQNAKVSYSYIADWTPVIEQQFLKGGLRLADVLNTVFDNSYAPYNTFVRNR